MELQLDTGKTYAIALESGGARGAYEIGVWQALEEAGIRYNAVAGTSVGALNGALMAMRDMNRAVEIWSDIRLSSVLALTDEEEQGMRRLFSGDMGLNDVQELLPRVVDVIRSGGLDAGPLRAWVHEVVDAEKIRRSDVELFVSTVDLTERKGLEVRLNDLPDEEICDMLLASAYHPAFKREPLGGKFFADGGFVDAIPIHALVERGYKDIIAVRLPSKGWERRFRIPDDVNVITIQATADLGAGLNFDAVQSRKNMAYGYFDAKRVLYGLYGKKYCVDRNFTDRFALDWLIRRETEAGEANLRTICEKKLPKLARKLDVKDGDYYELLVAVMEELAEKKGAEPMKLYSDADLLRIAEGE